MSKRVCKSWSEREDKFLINNFKDMTLQELAARLNRTYGGVGARLSKLRSENVIFGYPKKKPRKPHWWEMRGHSRKWKKTS